MLGVPRLNAGVLLVLCMLAAGCAESPSTSAVCPDGEVPLPNSGLCVSDAEALIVDAEVGSDPSALETMTDCTWRVNETAFPGGDVLLYRAAQCDGVTATLGLNAGARRGELFVETAAVGVAGDDAVVGVAIGVEPDDPTETIRTFVQADLEADGFAPAYLAQCQVRRSVYAPDAYVVDVHPIDALPSPSDDGPRSDCGRYGYTEESTAFWRLAHGFAWFFDLGQDAYHDIDPGSLTLIAKDERGTWTPVPSPEVAIPTTSLPEASDENLWRHQHR
ncbi:MAG: hypothetical protein AAFN13_16140 [Bacteroidota bacterium]